ncbi:MAG: alpha-glucan family phosphorylase [Thermodesulfobacteriota bacterium]|nr:alpha-glucan family phosphorylase [Thermodesulfobacteriota bacterium]
MSHLQIFQVLPNLPEPLAFLEVLSHNTWWCWQHKAIGLFRRIDPELWKESGKNPIVFLTNISQSRMEELSEDEGFLAQLKQVESHYEEQVRAKTEKNQSPFELEGRVAYFSMEYGIHESIPLFSGGLGVLAGDHLKAASDMRAPIVAVGLRYRHGYFHQFLNQDGWQQEDYPESDIFFLPVERAQDSSGNDVRISVTGPDCEIHAIVWKINVGLTPLYLLDTDLPENSSEVRDITSTLYSGGQKMRLAQEVLLGIGGVRALSAIGIYPTVYHINEGHPAFAGLERLCQIMSIHNVDLQTAMEIIPRTTVFTTHTPVAAGHDEFPAEIVRPYILPFEKTLGVKTDEILSWGQPDGANPDADLSMFVLGLRMAQYCNGVSRLHGNVARRMWGYVWPERPEDEIPISHITNGVHIPSWISSENAALFESHFGPEWSKQPLDPDIINNIDRIYDEELWRAHETCRSRLVRTCRELMGKQYMRRYASKAMMQEVESVLDHDTLTIAFGRRFASYKRANLLFHDIERLKALIGSEKQPVQFIFAGKAHPKDDEGKRLIQYIVQTSRRQAYRHSIIFIEDYDINIARFLIQGADVWLNNPRRPLEACGTSGMKAAINGVLNLSILDGWWNEAYTPEAGWRIGKGEEYHDPSHQDSVDSQALYNVLENDVIPCFYERRSGEAPARWIKMMKKSMEISLWNFSSCRMLTEYGEKFYSPADRRLRNLIENNAEEARKLGIQRKRLHDLWSAVWIDEPKREADGPSRVQDRFRLTCKVDLGELSPDEVDVELYYGRLKTVDSLVSSQIEPMVEKKALGNGRYLYDCTITCGDSGRYGFTARVTPRGDDLMKFAPGLITWSE